MQRNEYHAQSSFSPSIWGAHPMSCAQAAHINWAGMFKADGGVGMQALVRRMKCRRDQPLWGRGK